MDGRSGSRGIVCPRTVFVLTVAVRARYAGVLFSIQRQCQTCTSVMFFWQSWPSLDTCTLWVLPILHTRWCWGNSMLKTFITSLRKHGWWRHSQCHRGILHLHWQPWAVRLLMIFFFFFTLGVFVGAPSQSLWWNALRLKLPPCGPGPPYLGTKAYWVCCWTVGL